MVKHYLLVMIRMLAKEKIHVFSNVVSLAFGLGSFIYLALRSQPSL